MLWLYVLVLLYTFYYFAKQKYTYWIKLGVRGPRPLPFLGNFGTVILQKKSVNQCIKDIYKQYPEEKIVGIYRGFQPLLLIRDPELIKQILIKDFQFFQDRGISRSRSRIAENLFSVEGEKWRILRQKLTPVFTSKRLKDMIPLIENCIENYTNYVEYIVERNIDHEIRLLASKYTLQAIGSCAFGLDIDTYTDSQNKFTIMAKRVFSPSTFLKFITILDIIIPGLRKMFNTSADINDFFLNLVKNVIEERRNKPMLRKDFMDLMIELKEKGNLSVKNENTGMSEIYIDNELIAAQALVFYAAGFETSSATMSFMLYELALNQNIQEKVYQEIVKVTEKYNNKLTYESVKELIYLEMVFEETLRKHSVAGVLFRKCKTNYDIPGTNIKLQKDTPVIISVSGLQHDSKYFSNPEIFNPDNFLPENKIKRPQFTHMPFGEGPRNCIGMRFAIVQTVLGVASFLQKFKVLPSTKTKSQLRYDPKAITLTSLDGIWLKIVKR
ncbi:cytochrome P450 6B2-like [Achroia grisella]|uniref:cytochrome P450 6B2-like n=1 Tax=Achroia grisella TaxID=688607 RepID=UPI0027D2BD3D|nr:cytochrome P450 6B2-like [Achroia grisella]